MRFVIDSDLDDVALLAEAVMAVCAERVGEEQAREIELCVVEAVNNAIKHAYHGVAGGEVEVGLRFDERAAVIEVCDRGSAMPAGALEAADRPRTVDVACAAALPESGLGLVILRQLMDEVRYESRPERNVLTLVRRFGPHRRQVSVS